MDSCYTLLTLSSLDPGCMEDSLCCLATGSAFLIYPYSSVVFYEGFVDVK